MVARGGTAELGRSEELPANSPVIPPRSCPATPLSFPDWGSSRASAAHRARPPGEAGKHSSGARWSLPNPDPRAARTAAKPGCDIAPSGQHAAEGAALPRVGVRALQCLGENLLLGGKQAPALQPRGQHVLPTAASPNALRCSLESPVSCRPAPRIGSVTCDDSFGAGRVCWVRAVLPAGLSVPGAASPRGPGARRLWVSSDTGAWWVLEGLPISGDP